MVNKPNISIIFRFVNSSGNKRKNDDILNTPLYIIVI